MTINITYVNWNQLQIIIIIIQKRQQYWIRQGDLATAWGFHLPVNNTFSQNALLVCLAMLVRAGIATDCGLDCPGSIPGRDNRFDSFPQRPDPPKEYRWLFPRGLSGRDVKLTIHLLPVLGSRLVELYLHYPIRLHDARTALPFAQII
jgi:hypothetical protein